MTAPSPEGVRDGGGLLRASSAYTAATIITGACGLVRSKVGAVYLGPVGVGIVAQLNSLSILIGSVAAAGLSLAATKLIAEAQERGDEAQVRRVSTFVLAVPFAFGCILLALAVPVRGAMSSLFLGRNAHAGYILLAIASVPLNLLVGSAMAVLQGHQKIVRIARFSTINAFVSAAVMVALIATTGVDGAVIGILVTSALAVVLVLLLEPWLHRLPTSTWTLDQTSRRLLFSLGAAGLAVGVLEVGVEVVLRTVMVQRYGLRTNGTFQPVSLLALQVFLPVIVGITAFLVPRVSALQGSHRHAEATYQVDRAVRLVTLAITPIALVVIALRTLYIRYLFSGHFAAAGQAILVQAPGQVVQAVAYVLGAVLVPAGRVKAWFVVATSVYLTQMIVGIAMLRWLRLSALPIAFDAAWTLALVLVAVLLHRTDGNTSLSLAATRSSMVLAIRAIVIVAGAAAVCAVAPAPAGETTAAVAAAVWVRGATTHEERDRLRRGVRQRIGKRPTWRGSR